MRLPLSLSILLTLVFILGCTKDPNSIGKELLGPNDQLITDVSSDTAVASSSYSITSANNSTSLLVGKANNIEARMLLQFGTFPVDTNIANSIISAKIKMIPNYSFKDTVGIMAFTIHKMLKSWSEYSFTTDSLLADSYETVPVNTHSLNVNSKDTLTEFSLNTNLVAECLKGNAGYGIILIPDLNSNMIFSFNTYYYSSISDGRPALEIVYRTSSDTIDQTLTLRTTQDATIFSGTRPNSTSSLFYVQGGLICRGRLNFDVSHIPKGAAITQAYLDLKSDTNASSFGSYIDYKIFVQEIFSNDSIPTLSGTTDQGTLVGDSFTIDVRNIVQKWIGKNNYGVAIRSYNEFTQVERFAIYGVTADADKRPRLRIQYTYLP
jgi:hypothetical protein